eukprot:Partr_v1_DN28614_c1_g2_i3_m50565 putative dna-directed RNA polymerase
MNISVPVDCEASQASFSFASSEDILKLSVKSLNNPETFDPVTNYPTKGGLYDGALGPYDRSELCATCNLDSFSCPGHFGHVHLAVPLYHPLLFKHMFNLLRSTCFSCHHLKMRKAKSHRYLARLKLARAGMIFESIELATLDFGALEGDDEKSATSDYVVKMIDAFVSESFRKHSLQRPTAESKQGFVTLTYDYVRSLTKEALLVASGVRMCENCSAKCPTFRKESNSKIFASNLPTLDDCFTATGKSKSSFFTPRDSRVHIRKLWDNERYFLDELFGAEQDGKNGVRVSSAEMFFLDVVPVAPSKFRPISKMGDKQFDHAQNSFLLEIMKGNNLITESFHVSKGAELSGEGEMKLISMEKTTALINAWVTMQEAVNNLHDSTKNPKGKVMPSGIKQIMEKKEGLFRKHMMGKRVNFAARSVISPDPMIETSEIGIPLVFAKKLTFPEPVTQYNISDMRQAVVNGCDTYPGASAIQNEDGSLTTLERSTLEQRQALANQLLTLSSSSKSIDDDSSFVNKKVLRHLRDGDMLLLNRQPTLHKPSIMGHVARVLPGEKTIRMHYANCNTYNADFDGDEMNVHFPQNPIAQAEARLIMNTNNQYLVPTSGEPLRGLIQDHVVTGVLMTSRDTFLCREDYIQLMYGALPESNKRIVLLPPAILKPRPLWTGKQVISTLLVNLTAGYKSLNMESTSQVPSKAWSMMQRTDTEEGKVIVIDNELVTGVLDKKQFGAKPYGLVHACFEVYGGDMAGRLLSCLGRLFTRYVQTIGFSCRMDDLIVLPAADVARKAKIDHALQQGRKILLEFAKEDSQNDFVTESPLESQLKSTISSLESTPDQKMRARKTLSALEDKKLFNALENTIRSDEKLAALDNKMKSQTGGVTTGIVKSTIPTGLLKSFPDNGMQLMTVSGAKGSNVNVTQISCMLGQQELEGRRVPVMVSGKTLPSFRAYDLGPRAGGYITGRFLTGIKPQEYFFHCMAGREGLVDTAVKTARSGYLQRCLIKHMEGLKVNYDCTVRDAADGSVYQFHYGEDSLDVTKASYLKHFRFNVDNYEAFLEKYCPHEAAKSLDTITAVSHSRKAYKKPSKYEPTLSKFHPGRYLGAVSDKFYADLQDYLIKDPDRMFGADSSHKSKASKRPNEKTFEALMQLKYLHSLVEPGEAVGLLAAQSVGEPSTQMTLNTFHFAGHGAKNVTLGIPRLREIIMTASTKPKTPQMRIPFLAKYEKMEAESICKRTSKLTLDMIMDQAKVVEKFVCREDGRRMRSYRIRLEFCTRAKYQEEYGLSVFALRNVLENQVMKKLAICIQRELKLANASHVSEEGLIGKGLDISRFQEGAYAVPDSDQQKKKTSTSVLSENEDDSMEADATFVNRAQKKQQRPSYDDPDDDEKENMSKTIDNDSGDEAATAAVFESEDELERKELVLGKNEFLQDYTFDKEGSWCEFEVQLPSDSKKILMVTHIETLAPQCVIFEVPGISKCFLSENKETGELAITTDGTNIKGMCNMDEYFDLSRLYSNDIAAIKNTFGVEAARSTIISEIGSVFAVYGIEVDRRHLTLIADYMTFEGGYKPFNRVGMESSVSPFAKMTFETTFQFLTDAAIRGDKDTLLGPSARIVMGQVVTGGTGSFEIVHPIS